jgi:hypothetical protein
VEPADYDDLEQLYSSPLDRFVELRASLAKAARARGDREAAATLRRQKKPTVTAWALNQLSREHREELERLFGLDDRLRHAQVSGAGPKVLRELVETRRTLISQLIELAEEILKESGHTGSHAALERISATLQGLGADPEAREKLRQARLTEELQPPDSWDALGSEPAPSPFSSEPEEARGWAGRLAEEAGDLEGEAVRLREEADRLGREAEHAAKLAERARAEAERLATEAERARREAARAQDMAEKSQARAAERRRAADEAAKQAANPEETR